MALVPGCRPSPAVATGLSVATAALDIAGAATDAVPIAKQILNSAAHISAAAERIQKRREAMYLLVEKVDIYATQIDIAVAGRVLDASLQRRLARLYSVFQKIEALVDAKAGNNNPLTRVWQNVITKPTRANALIVELEREVQLFQLSLVVDSAARAVDDAARAVAAEAKYDGQFRILRDCDIEKLGVIEQRETDEGVVVWASARVKRQLMVIRYLDSHPNAKTSTMMTLNSSSQPYHEYLENIKKVSTVRGSHPHIVQLYGHRLQGPEVVFRAGMFPLFDYLDNVRPQENDVEGAAVIRLRLVFKLLDASAHLAHVHGLSWVGDTAIVDENGEPRIGLFDDIVRSDPDQSPSIEPFIYFNIMLSFNSRFSEEADVVEQVHGSSLRAFIEEQLRDGNDTHRLRQVWEVIRREKLPVEYYKRAFPINSGNLSLSQESVARSRSYFTTNVTEKNDRYWNCIVSFIRRVIAGGDANILSQICISMWRSDDKYTIEVHACTHGDSHVHWDRFWIHIPSGFPILADIVRAAGLPGDFEHSWRCNSPVYIYSQS